MIIGHTYLTCREATPNPFMTNLLQTRSRGWPKKDFEIVSLAQWGPFQALSWTLDIHPINFCISSFYEECSVGGPSIQYVHNFGAILTPSPLVHKMTSLSLRTHWSTPPPLQWSHHYNYKLTSLTSLLIAKLEAHFNSQKV